MTKNKLILESLELRNMKAHTLDEPLTTEDHILLHKIINEYRMKNNLPIILWKIDKSESYLYRGEK